MWRRGSSGAGRVCRRTNPRHDNRIYDGPEHAERRQYSVLKKWVILVNHSKHIAGVASGPHRKTFGGTMFLTIFLAVLLGNIIGTYTSTAIFVLFRANRYENQLCDKIAKAVKSEIQK
jgi:hypothetical protein